jgi:hypothetical protein
METGYIIGILVAVVIVGLGIYGMRSRHKRKSIDGEIARGGPMMARTGGIEDKRISPGGLKLLVESGANVTDEEIGVIEDGILDCFTKAKLRGYTHALKLSEYTVAILKSERSPVDQIYSFLVPDLTGAYAGIEYDKGGYVLAAEAVCNFGGIAGNVFCVADAHGMPTEKDREALYNAAMFGAEHVILKFNDPELYAKTEIHTAGGHPLF